MKAFLSLACVMAALLVSVDSAPSAPATLHTLILLVNYQDTQPGSLTPAQAATDFMSAVGTYYEEQSYQTVAVTAEGHGWYQIPYSVNGPCDIGGVDAASLAAAQNDGVNVDAFDHFIYVLSGGVPSCAGGIAWSGGNLTHGAETGGSALVTDPSMGRHEFGHAVGLNHSDLGPLGGYGFDRLPAGQLLQLGWLDAPVPVTGTYDLTSVEQPFGLRSLQVPRPDGASRLVLEYRAAIGGVYVEEDDPRNSSYVYALDASPCGSRVLTAGQRFYDTDSRTLFSLDQSDASLLTVTRDVDAPPAPPPDTTPPTVPSGLAATKQGANVVLTWTASFDAGCPPITYTVSRNGAVLGQTQGTSWTDAHVPKKTTLLYAVNASDPSGNVSAAALATVKT